jgi:hypothetical protein
MRTRQERDEMVESASRNLCETLAKVQEEHQYRYQLQKLMDHCIQIEAESAGAMLTQCKKIQKWDETTIIDLGIWLPTEVDNLLDPKRFSKMLDKHNGTGQRVHGGRCTAEGY